MPVEIGIAAVGLEIRRLAYMGDQSTNFIGAFESNSRVHALVGPLLLFALGMVKMRTPRIFFRHHVRCGEQFLFGTLNFIFEFVKSLP